MATIGEKIKIARQINGYTQSQLADKLGCSYNTISRWENNRSGPDKRELDKLSDILGVNFDEEIVAPVISKESELQDIRLELSSRNEEINNLRHNLTSSKRTNSILTIIIFVMVIIIVCLLLLIGSFQYRNPNEPDGPATIYYYVQESAV